MAQTLPHHKDDAQSLPGRPSFFISRVALEACVEDLDLDREAAADVVRSILRAQQVVIARQAASEPGDAAKIGEGVL